MSRRYTQEQRDFIVNYGDYPVWVIVEAFEEKFGFKPPKDSVIAMRYEQRGSTNWMATKGPKPRRRGGETAELQDLRRLMREVDD